MQPLLKLPFKGTLKCSQNNETEQGRTHHKENINNRYALDFEVDGVTPFLVLASAEGKAKIWKCCKHDSSNGCECGLGFGNQVRITHGEFFTFYAHLQKILVKNNQTVKPGEPIGIAGRTGLAGTVHLHWSLGKESKESKILQKKFIPFWSVEAEKIEIKKGQFVSSTYFKENEKYTSIQ